MERIHPTLADTPQKELRKAKKIGKTYKKRDSSDSKPATDSPKNMNKELPNNSKNSGKWTLKEEIIYLTFLCENIEGFRKR